MATYSYPPTQSWKARRSTKIFFWTLVIAFLLGAVPSLLAAEERSLAEWVASETPRGELAALDVSPDFVSLEAGRAVEFIAAGLYEAFDGAQWCTDLTEAVLWASSDPATVSVDPSGRAIALAEGEVSITASTEALLTAVWVTVRSAMVLDVPAD